MTRRFSNFKQRVILGFALTLFAGLLIGSLSFFILHDVEKSGSAAVIEYAQSVIDAERLRYAAERAMASSRGYFLTRDNRYLSLMEAERSHFAELMHVLLREHLSERERRLIDRIRAADQEHRTALDHVMVLRGQRGLTSSAVRHFEARVMPKRLDLEAAISAFVQHEREQMVEAQNSARRATAEGRALVAATAVVGLTLATVLAFIFARTLTRLYDDARRATRMRDDLLAVVSHDLRNPITAAKLSADLLTRRGADPFTREMAGRIGFALDSATALIRGLLDLAKSEAGRLVLEEGVASVPRMVDETLAVLRPMADAKGVALELAVQPDASLVCDRERVKQVLANLVSNAIKFTPGKGSVAVEVRRSDEEMVFRVRDTGRGIAPEDLPHVFDKYWQATGTTQKGAGLGLAIAKSFVEAHGGRIWVESALGQGTTFTFALPLDRRYAGSELSRRVS
nr:hypothetical protein [uncultured bacterium]